MVIWDQDYLDALRSQIKPKVICRIMLLKSAFNHLQIMSVNNSQDWKYNCLFDMFESKAQICSS